MPVRLKHVAETDPFTGSNAIWHGISRGISGGSGCASHVLFRRVRASVSQKLTVPSEPEVRVKIGRMHKTRQLSFMSAEVNNKPQVLNEPCTGWKVISFTE